MVFQEWCSFRRFFFMRTHFSSEVVRIVFDSVSLRYIFNMYNKVFASSYSNLRQVYTFFYIQRTHVLLLPIFVWARAKICGYLPTHTYTEHTINCVLGISEKFAQSVKMRIRKYSRAVNEPQQQQQQTYRCRRILSSEFYK